MFSVTFLKEYRFWRDGGLGRRPPFFVFGSGRLGVLPGAFPIAAGRPDQIRRFLKRLGNLGENIPRIRKIVGPALAGYELQLALGDAVPSRSERFFPGQHAPDDFEKMPGDRDDGLAFDLLRRNLLGAMQMLEISCPHRRLGLNAVPGGLDGRPFQVLVALAPGPRLSFDTIGTVQTRDQAGVRREPFHRLEPADVADLEENRSRRDEPNAIYRQEELLVLR